MNKSTDKNTSFAISSDIKVGSKEPLLILAGPCQIESEGHCLDLAGRLKEICRNFPVNLVFKSSFDKANRTSLTGKRGPGLEEGLKILAKVKEVYDLPLVTDVHNVDQVQATARIVDIIQTPAFLCRQTDLLVAAGESQRVVNIKKGQFLAPEDMRFVAEKVASSGNTNVMLCERGSCFGYRDLIVDPRSLIIMKSFGYPVVFDATHSVQSMGGAGGASGGNREFILPLVKAAVALGVDALFIECHDQPVSAPSDGASMLPIDNLEEVLENACRLRGALTF